MLNLKGFYGRIKRTFSDNNYVRLIINAALVMSAIIVIAVFMHHKRIQVAMSLMVVGQKHYLNVVNHVVLKPLCNALQESWFFYGL